MVAQLDILFRTNHFIQKSLKQTWSWQLFWNEKRYGIWNRTLNSMAETVFNSTSQNKCLNIVHPENSYFWLFWFSWTWVRSPLLSHPEAHHVDMRVKFGILHYQRELEPLCNWFVIVCVCVYILLFWSWLNLNCSFLESILGFRVHFFNFLLTEFCTWYFLDGVIIFSIIIWS